jgi:hypothetical protein
MRKMEVYITIRWKNTQYYLMKVIRRDLDIYCIPPHLGIHYSLHESGESHFRYERGDVDSEKVPPLILMDGEAGTPYGKGIIRASLSNLDRAIGICVAIFSISELSNDYAEFTRSSDYCFTIDDEIIPKDTQAIQVGIWAVPKRNPIGFTFNNPEINEDCLYKIEGCEPQIWIYARPI